MKCAICKLGETRRGTVSVTLERDQATLVFKGVPAEICENCGEEYVDEETTARLMRDADRASDSGVQVEVRRYAV